MHGKGSNAHLHIFTVSLIQHLGIAQGSGEIKSKDMESQETSL